MCCFCTCKHGYVFLICRKQNQVSCTLKHFFLFLTSGKSWLANVYQGLISLDSKRTGHKAEMGGIEVCFFSFYKFCVSLGHRRLWLFTNSFSSLAVNCHASWFLCCLLHAFQLRIVFLQEWLPPKARELILFYLNQKGRTYKFILQDISKYDSTDPFFY